jgi:hypothetical protein
MASIQIFKPGTVTSMEGTVVSFTEAELRGIAERYDPALHEAPFVVGHPQHDAPAYAWTAGLSFADGALTADAQQVDADFAELHRKGRFKKISARFYTPSSPNSPTPGEYYLRDVGCLGAMAPAVKGLRTASFSDDGSQFVTCEISFGDLPAYSGGYIARMFRGLRDWLIAEKGQEVADRVLPDWQVDSLREIAQRAEDATGGLASFRDVDFLDIATNPRSSTTARKEQPSMSKTPEQLQADLESARAEIQRLQDAERKRGVDARHAEHISFADTLITGARWPADLKDVLVATLDHLATPAESGCVSFGDGEAAKPLHEVLRTRLEALPPIVSFGEIARKGEGAGAGLNDRQIADRAAAHRTRLAAQGRHISIGQAIDDVKAGTDKE